MPADRSSKPSSSSSKPYPKSREEALEQAVLASTETAFSPLDLLGKSRKGPVKGLLKSTSFRAKLAKIQADDSLDPQFCPEVTWAAAMSMGVEMVDEVETLRKEVSSCSVVIIGD